MTSDEAVRRESEVAVRRELLAKHYEKASRYLLDALLYPSKEHPTARFEELEGYLNELPPGSLAGIVVAARELNESASAVLFRKGYDFSDD